MQSAAGGMLRLLSWSSGPAADKLATPEMTDLTGAHYRPPSMEPQTTQTLKRKRVDGHVTEETTNPAKRRIERVPHGSMPKQSTTVGTSPASPPREAQKAPASILDLDLNHTDTSSQDRPADSSQGFAMAGSRTHTKIESMRRTIQSQIGLEILLKHKELRLIDQELAKCQIALEQLRRCSEIPFPASRLSEAVSRGEGPALRSSFSGPLPSSPAPWGVTDGPYSRHYAKWLLPDTRFDGGDEMEQVPARTPAGKAPTKARSTRGSFTETTTIATKSRGRGGKLKALSSGYPQPKDKAGLVIQKRKSDGAMIKLVCLDCRRENFSSAQGFINHCRIAHSRSFASHDAAADACGELVEVDEAGSVIGNEAPSASTAGMVHPLIRSAHLLKNKHTTLSAPSKDDTTDHVVPSTETPSTQTRLRGGMGSPSPNFRPSPLTPHLSAFIRSQGLVLNLETFVSDAKAPVIAEDSSDDEHDEEEDPHVEETAFRGRHPQIAGTKQPIRSTISPLPFDRSNSNKSTQRFEADMEDIDHLATPSLPPQAHHTGSLATDLYDLHGCPSLDPSPTNESNQAPSLVDDDEDYEAHSPSLSSSVSDDEEDAEPDFEIQDDEPSGPSTRQADPEYNGTAKERVLSPQRRRPSAFRRSIGDREQKHVSFVSPSPARELQRSKKDNEKKRKRF